jgi:hypothetical protein
VGLLPSTPIAPQPRHARRRAQLSGFCLLLTLDRERALEMRLSFGRIWLGHHHLVFEMLIGQVRENGRINVVFGKLLGHAELLEPSRNFLHRGHRVPSGPERVFHHGTREFTPISPR